MGQKQINQEAQSINKSAGASNVMRQKKASSMMTNTVESLLIGLVVVILATALAPEMFLNIADLEDQSNTPNWVPTVLYVVVGIGLVLSIYYVFMKNKK